MFIVAKNRTFATREQEERVMICMWYGVALATCQI